MGIGKFFAIYQRRSSIMQNLKNNLNVVWATMAAVGFYMAILLIILSFAMGCGDEGTSQKDELVGSGFDVAPAAKPIANVNPFQGLTEEGYAEGIGDPQNVDKLLKIISMRLSMLTKESGFRKALTDRLSQDGKPVSLADLLLESDKISSHLPDPFKEIVEAQGVTGRLGSEILGGNTDAEALVKTSHALFGLQVSLLMPHRAHGMPTRPCRSFTCPSRTNS